MDKKFHTFARWFIPRLGVSEPEKATVIEETENRTAGAIRAVQIEVTSLSKSSMAKSNGFRPPLSLFKRSLCSDK